MLSIMRRQLLTGLILLTSVGCDAEAPPLRPDGGAITGPPTTYHADVAPLVARECLGCHVEGGIAPFALDRYEQLVEYAEYVVPAVMTGYMPPWLPDRECRTYQHQRGLSMDERQVIERWVAQGMERGDPADEPPRPPPPPAFEATHVAHMLEPYTPDPERPDDYRCFLLDHTFEGDTFLQGSTVVPGARAIVHHVLTYAVPPQMLPAIEAADAADEGPGYTCFGGPVPAAEDGASGSLGLVGLGGWVPGAVPNVGADGVGAYVPAGSRVVM